MTSSSSPPNGGATAASPSNMAAAPPRSMSVAANSRSPMKRASLIRGWCWPPARRALRLNLPGADLPGVYTFRDTRDVDLLLALAAAKKRVVVVGGGLLGLEAAYGLAKAGAPVTLIHLMDRLMERQLDGPAGGTAEVAGRTQGHQYPAQRQHRAHSRHGAGRRRRTDRRPHARGRRGDLCGRHPAEYVAGQGSRHSRQPRRRGRRSSADRRAGHLCARRMRRASRHLLRPGRAGL